MWSGFANGARVVSRRVCSATAAASRAIDHVGRRRVEPGAVSTSHRARPRSRSSSADCSRPARRRRRTCRRCRAPCSTGRSRTRRAARGTSRAATAPRRSASGGSVVARRWRRSCLAREVVLERPEVRRAVLGHVAGQAGAEHVGERLRPAVRRVRARSRRRCRCSSSPGRWVASRRRPPPRGRPRGRPHILVRPLVLARSTHRFVRPSLRTQPIEPRITTTPSTPAMRFGPSSRRSQRITTNAPRPASAIGAAVAFMNR